VPLLTSFEKRWKNIESIKIIINTEKKIFYSKSFKKLQFSNCDNPYWGSRLLNAINNIDDEFIIMLFDDFFLNKDIDNSFLELYLNKIFSDQNVAVIYLEKITELPGIVNEGLIKENSCSDLLIRLPKNMKYRLNTAPAIWRKSVLKKYIKKNDTPWGWELFGSLRTIRDEGFYCVNSKDSIISYYNNGGRGGVIHRGLWAKGAPLWIKNDLGIDVLSGSFRLEENNQSVNKRSFLWKLNFIIAGLRSNGIRGLLLILSMYVDKLRKK
jgi:hypothetical protein